MSIKIAEQIAALRKKKGLTQEELAKALGVTNQAVSKWESNKCCPDIELLPQLARIFGCSIDSLFDIEKDYKDGCAVCTEFPWADDEIIRGVVCKGRKLLSIQDGIVNKFFFEYIGEAKDVQSQCSLIVTGNVGGTCAAGDGMVVQGNVSGGCSAGDGMVVQGSLYGGCTVGDGVTVGGSINGAITCGDSINCNGSINGDITCQSLSVGGDVVSEEITGDVVCKCLKCDNVDGNVRTDEQE